MAEVVRTAWIVRLSIDFTSFLPATKSLYVTVPGHDYDTVLSGDPNDARVFVTERAASQCMKRYVAKYPKLEFLGKFIVTPVNMTWTEVSHE